MNNEEFERLKEIKIENFIWIIYIGVILLSWYSNSLENNIKIRRIESNIKDF